MRIELQRLVLHNFKGIPDLSADFDFVTRVLGANGTGKSTLVDAWHWLLFGKDSQNHADFEIKTLDTSGQPIHNLHHEVEGTLSIDGKRLTLKKSYYEKWVKKRGAASPEFSGHSTDHYIDGVPVKQKEYKDRVDSIVDEDLFRLLTNPWYFSEMLSKQERRKLLFEVCGDVSDAQVIASDDGLQRLPGFLGDRSIEDHRKVIAAKRAEVNRELLAIPTRIDEASRARPDTKGLSEVDLQAQLDGLRADREAKAQEIGRLQNGSEVAQQQKRLAELEGELLHIRNRAQGGASDSVQVQRERVSRVQGDLDDVRTEIVRAELVTQQYEDRETEQETIAAEQRAKWAQVNKRAFAADVTDTCPACHQPLPEEEVAAAVERARANFNQQKSEELETIVTSGTQAAEKAAGAKEKVEKVSKHVAVLKEQEQALVESLEAAQAKLKTMTGSVSDVSQSPEYAAKAAEIRGVQGKITQLNQSVMGDVEKARQAMLDLGDEIRRTESRLATFELSRKLDQRIEQLTKQERDLAAEYERLEEQVYLCDQFTRTKAHLLEEKINSKFCMARFKLFAPLINGGLEETCETMYAGVPFSRGLNRSACQLVGLDIIRTLSEHYGVHAPVFVDNCEGINQLPDMECQLIALYVTDDKKLSLRHSKE